MEGLKDIIQLRHKLHQNAELAFQENQTVKILKDFIMPFKPDQIIDSLGSTGVAFIFQGNLPDKASIIFRADLDALPIKEVNSFAHQSKNKHVSHKCGHDGHMAMVAGLARELSENKQRGDVTLLFQPAEEIGAGALKVVEDKKFKQIKGGYIFGLHNLPEYPAGKVVVRRGTFSCAARSLEVIIQGESSHAAHPELARSPYPLFESLKAQIEDLNSPQNNPHFFLSTLTHLMLGEPSFGITPGSMSVFYTLRSSSDDVLKRQQERILDLIHKTFTDFKISFSIKDSFPATVNHNQAVDLLVEALSQGKFSYEEKLAPFRWAEDFGYFTQQIPGAFFGLGTGGKFDLHHAEYDFNDDVLPIGIDLYIRLIRTINQAHS